MKYLIIGLAFLSSCLSDITKDGSQYEPSIEIESVITDMHITTVQCNITEPTDYSIQYKGVCYSYNKETGIHENQTLVEGGDLQFAVEYEMLKPYDTIYIKAFVDNGFTYATSAEVEYIIPFEGAPSAPCSVPVNTVELAGQSMSAYFSRFYIDGMKPKFEYTIRLDKGEIELFFNERPSNGIYITNTEYSADLTDVHVLYGSTIYNDYEISYNQGVYVERTDDSLTFEFCDLEYNDDSNETQLVSGAVSGKISSIED